MKLVKISEYLYLNPDFIEAVEANGKKSTSITMTRGDIFIPHVSIEKVIEAISGSEKQNFKGDITHERTTV